MIRLRRYHNTQTTNFVRCERCERINRSKPIITTQLKLPWNINTVSHLIYGVVYKIPMCCNIRFAWLNLRGITHIALVTDLIRKRATIDSERWCTRPGSNIGYFLPRDGKTDRYLTKHGVKLSTN